LLFGICVGLFVYGCVVWLYGYIAGWFKTI